MTNGHRVCWVHSLCKNIQLEFHEGRPIIQDPRGAGYSQGDDTWLRSGYFLKWRQGGGIQQDESEVSLIIFGASLNLKGLFEDLAFQPAWEGTLTDPMNLFIVALDDLFTQINETIFKVREVVRSVEQVCSLNPMG